MDPDNIDMTDPMEPEIPCADFGGSELKAAEASAEPIRDNTSPF
jgi:hypothetical protein